MMKFIGIIPARYGSSRFPGKPLADICGMTMIERVYRQASKELEEVVVATDDERILEAVETFGGKAVMTSADHRSGTDRCYEAYRNVNSDADAVINIQGDEPFIAPEQIAELKRCFESPTTELATLVRPVKPGTSFEKLSDPNTPKVVFDDEMNALYFSRSVIPYVRSCDKDEWAVKSRFYTHVGMYAYRAATLAAITKLPQGRLELAESLEQLRWLENGYKIKVGITELPTIGIDTPDDLAKAVEFCKSGLV